MCKTVGFIFLSFHSVITTIEKRFDIPSRVSGAIASTFEIGNLLTIIFVSYLGSHRHIPVWIGKGNLFLLLSNNNKINQIKFERCTINYSIFLLI